MNYASAVNDVFVCPHECPVPRDMLDRVEFLVGIAREMTSTAPFGVMKLEVAEEVERDRDNLFAFIERLNSFHEQFLFITILVSRYTPILRWRSAVSWCYKHREEIHAAKCWSRG